MERKEGGKVRRVRTEAGKEEKESESGWEGAREARSVDER